VISVLFCGCCECDVSSMPSARLSDDFHTTVRILFYDSIPIISNGRRCLWTSGLCKYRWIVWKNIPEFIQSAFMILTYSISVICFVWSPKTEQKIWEVFLWCFICVLVKINVVEILHSSWKCGELTISKEWEQCTFPLIYLWLYLIP
jgi:hypothetical protein